MAKVDDVIAKIKETSYNFELLGKSGEDIIISRLMKILMDSKSESNVISAAKTLWAKIRPDKSEVKVEETRSPYEVFVENEEKDDRQLYH
jgi:hypothetical protein